MHTDSTTSLCYGLPAVHVLSSSFGEFPQNHSRETYQIWSGSPGLLGRITFLAPLSTHTGGVQETGAATVSQDFTTPPPSCPHRWPQWPFLGESLGARRSRHVALLPSPHRVKGSWWNLCRVLGSTNHTNASVHTPDPLRHRFTCSLLQTMPPVWT